MGGEEASWRGWRELPIQPDIVGLTVDTQSDQVVEVKLLEDDGVEEVELYGPRG